MTCWLVSEQQRLAEDEQVITVKYHLHACTWTCAITVYSNVGIYVVVKMMHLLACKTYIHVRV